MFKFKRLEVANKADVGCKIVALSNDEATIYVYDAIGSMFGVDAQSFIRDLNGLDAKKITMRINSPGGDVFEAKAIAAAIKAHPAEITAQIDGLAASAATTIALAADRVEMAAGSFFMIHNAWSIAMGDAAEMTKMAAMLDKITVSIAQDYCDRTGKPMDEVRAMMDEETWLSAQEALDGGFIDAISEGTKARAMWDLSGFDKAPKIETASNEAVNDEFNLEHLKRRLNMLERIA